MSPPHRNIKCSKCGGIRSRVQKGKFYFYHCSKCNDYVPESTVKPVVKMSEEKVPSKYSYNDKGQISGWRATDEKGNKK